MKPMMNDLEPRLVSEYAAILKDYLGGIGEAALERAYELGRRALAEGIGALDLAKVHHEALASSVPRDAAEGDARMLVQMAGTLFVESLTPYEMTHRGFRETNAALGVSEARYRDLFENANDIVFTADLDGHFTSINRAGERLTGYERNEVLSTKFLPVVAPEYVDLVNAARELTLSGKQEDTRYELEIVTKDGRRVPLEVNTRLIYRDGKPSGVQGIARDITERKHAAQALHRLNARLEEEARRIAHALHDEAGQLLTSVYLAVAELAGELPGGGREKLESVSALLDQLAGQLRQFSHELRPVVLDDFGLVPALEFLAASVSRRRGLEIAIQASMDTRLPTVVETALYRIFQEALTNVAKHARARHVTIRLQQDDRMIECSIADDGSGFDPSAVCSKADKTCLGLIGMRERLAALGGTLSITSDRGQGTTLTMRIPRRAAADSPGR